MPFPPLSLAPASLLAVLHRGANCCCTDAPAASSWPSQVSPGCVVNTRAWQGPADVPSDARGAGPSSFACCAFMAAPLAGEPAPSAGGAKRFPAWLSVECCCAPAAASAAAEPADWVASGPYVFIAAGPCATAAGPAAAAAAAAAGAPAPAGCDAGCPAFAGPAGCASQGKGCAPTPVGALMAKAGAHGPHPATGNACTGSSAEAGVVHSGSCKIGSGAGSCGAASAAVAVAGDAAMSQASPGRGLAAAAGRAGTCRCMDTSWLTHGGPVVSSSCSTSYQRPGHPPASPERHGPAMQLTT